MKSALWYVKLKLLGLQSNLISGKSVVEATLAGRWLYEKSGFTVKQHYSVEASGELFRGIAERLFFMVRPRAGDT
jgi:hypothetical protein